MPLGELVSWNDILNDEVEEADFLLDPYVVREGITFLWGRWGRGKSPVTWWMAHAMGSGQDFFGLPTKQCRVLYIDVDSPPSSARSRIKHLPLSPCKNVKFLLAKPFSFPSDPEQDAELAKIHSDWKPDVVFLNTLRKIHDLDDRESRNVKMVYSYYQRVFEKSALIFVHHEKKESLDPKAKKVSHESFSGSQAWINDAQVGLHLDVHVVRHPQTKAVVQNLKLVHFKSQISEQINDLPLLLARDGVTLSSRRKDALESVLALVKKGCAGTTLDREAAGILGCSESWARKLRHDLENGRYPGSRMFLSSDSGEETESLDGKSNSPTTGGSKRSAQ